MKLLHYRCAILPKIGILYKNQTCIGAAAIEQRAINTFVKTYENFTPQGLHFHLSLSEAGVCYIIVRDLYDGSFDMQYFTNVNRALRFINNI